MTTTSAHHESPDPHGRLESQAAAARTEALYAQYHRTVGGLCRALLRDRAEAEDAAQQTFLSAHRALLNGSEPREPAAWLATIARNECWARIKTRMREPLPADRLETVSASDPVAEAIRRADLAALWSAIESLPAPQRNALLLREFGGLSYDELAAALDVSGSAVESLLFRARRSVQVRMRAAYASLSGASWIEALVRVFAGGGAPVAAKVAALGVGAAALGSGAVVVPQVLRDNHTHLRPPVRTATVHATQTTPSTPAVTVLAEQAASAAVVPAGRPRGRRGGRSEGETGPGHDGRDDGEVTTRRSGSGSDRSGPGGGDERTGGDRSGRDEGPDDRSGGDDPAAGVTVAETVETEPSEERHGGHGGDSGASDDSEGHGGEGP